MSTMALSRTTSIKQPGTSIKQPGLQDMGVPEIQTRLEAFLMNQYQQSLRLGSRVSRDERWLARHFATKHGLCHNIPRPSSVAPEEGGALAKTESLDLVGMHVWKPNKLERDMMDLLATVAECPTNKLSLSPDFDDRERFVAHYVAESMGLEHQTINSKKGRRLTVWKVQSPGLPPVKAPHEELPPALSLPLTRCDTWTPGSPLPEWVDEDGPADPPRGGTQGGAGLPLTPDVADPFPAVVPETADPSGADQAGPDSSSLALSRQMSTRVINETAELSRRVQRPTAPKRITTGTGEVYTVVDSGTGERAIFKPAAQQRHDQRRHNSFGNESDAGNSLGASLGAGCPSDRASVSTLSSSAPSRGGLSSLGSDLGTSSYSDGGVDQGFAPEEFDQGAPSSCAHLKEVAAYQLDHFGFAGVLPTMEVKVALQDEQGAMTGMIQKYMEHQETADEDEWGRRQINALAVREVHKIGILDLRLFNEDRHGGNLLLDFTSNPGGGSNGGSGGGSGGGGSGGARLVPIDHELTLPPWRCLDGATFCWHGWPQAKVPFDEETLSYVRALDLGRDSRLLRGLGIHEASIATYRICCTLLKMGAERGLTLHSLGSMLLRDPDLDYSDQVGPLLAQTRQQLDPSGDGPGSLDRSLEERPSTLEKLVSLATARALQSPSCADLPSAAAPEPGGGNSPAFGDAELEHFVQLVDEFITAKAEAESKAEGKAEGSLVGGYASGEETKGLEGAPLRRTKASGP